MVGRTPHEAWNTYIAPLREAIRCVTSDRLVLRARPTGLRANANYSIALNNMNSVPLQGIDKIFMLAGQRIRIEEWQSAYARERYRVVPFEYTYGFTIAEDGAEVELLTFHWNRTQASPPPISAGHLHIGRGLLKHPTPIRARDFHNAHIPTGIITLATVVRFATTELGVTPLVAEWETILRESEGAIQG